MSKKMNELDLVDIFGLVKKNFWKIFLCGVICAVLAGVFTSFFVEPKYSSSMKMVVISRSNENALTVSDVQMSTLLIGDCIEVLRSRDLMEDIIDALSIDEISAAELANNIEIESPEGTRTLNITVTADNSLTAKRIADELFNHGSPLIREKLDVKQVEIIEEPIAIQTPTSPNVRAIVLVGGIAGIFLVILFLIIGKMTNNKLSTEEEIESELGLTVLASIPRTGVQTKKRMHRKVINPENGDDSHQV